MFRDRPLTWLFIIATVAIDLVLILIDDKSDLIQSFTVGYVLGQLAALSIWSIRGTQHRLARASIAIIATGLLSFTIEIDGGNEPIWMAFYTLYVALVMFFSLASNCSRYLLLKKSEDEELRTRLRIPLIEFFGWTVVVAIVSFGARHMDFGFLRPDVLITIVSLLAVPACMAVFVHSDLREMSKLRAVGFICVGIAAAVAMSSEHVTGEYAVFVQGAYLTAWLAVVGMDNLRQEACLARESPVSAESGLPSLDSDALSPARTEPQTSSDDQTSPLQLHDPRA